MNHHKYLASTPPNISRRTQVFEKIHPGRESILIKGNTTSFLKEYRRQFPNPINSAPVIPVDHNRIFQTILNTTQLQDVSFIEAVTIPEELSINRTDSCIMTLNKIDARLKILLRYKSQYDASYTKALDTIKPATDKQLKYMIDDKRECAESHGKFNSKLPTIAELRAKDNKRINIAMTNFKFDMAKPNYLLIEQLQDFKRVLTQSLTPKHTADVATETKKAHQLRVSKAEDLAHVLIDVIGHDDLKTLNSIQLRTLDSLDQRGFQDRELAVQVTHRLASVVIYIDRQISKYTPRTTPKSLFSTVLERASRGIMATTDDYGVLLPKLDETISAKQQALALVAMIFPTEKMTPKDIYFIQSTLKYDQLLSATRVFIEKKLDPSLTNHVSVASAPPAEVEVAIPLMDDYLPIDKNNAIPSAPEAVAVVSTSLENTSLMDDTSVHAILLDLPVAPSGIIFPTVPNSVIEGHQTKIASGTTV